MSRYPSVSVIVSYHNEGNLIDRALQSIADQTYTGPIETVVIDDASEIPFTLSQSLSQQIRVLRSEENLYAGGARNLAVSHASGEYLCFLDADDEYLPERIESQVSFLLSHPDVLYVGSPYWIHRGKIWLQNPRALQEFDPGLLEKSQVLPDEFRFWVCNSYYCNTGAITLRRSVFERLKGFDASYRWGEEWDLQVRAAQLGKVGFTSTPSYRYLCRPNSITSTENPEKHVSAARMHRLWRKTVAGLPPAIRQNLRSKEQEAWLLAAQFYLEGRHDAKRAFRCVCSSLSCGASVWGMRSFLRTALHSCRDFLLGQNKPPLGNERGKPD